MSSSNKDMQHCIHSNDDSLKTVIVAQAKNIAAKERENAVLKKQITTQLSRIAAQERENATLKKQIAVQLSKVATACNLFGSFSK